MTKQGIVTKALTLGLCMTLAVGQMPCLALADEVVVEVDNATTVLLEENTVSENVPDEEWDLADKTFVMADEIQDNTEEVDFSVPNGQEFSEDEFSYGEATESSSPEVIGNEEIIPSEEMLDEGFAANGMFQTEDEKIESDEIVDNYEHFSLEEGFLDTNDSLETASFTSSDEIGGVTEENITFEDELELSNAELFAGYVEQTLYESLYGDITPFGNFGETRLSGLDLVYYREIKDFVKRVASGQEDAAAISIVTRQYSEADLGMSYESVDAAAVQKALRSAFYALLADCPYDLYWFDKTKGVDGKYIYNTDGSSRVVETAVFGLIVADAYKDHSWTGNAQLADYIVNTTLTRAASSTVSQAQDVVNQYASLSDWEKVTAYKDWICNAVEYNHATQGISYGDPWQIIYVFDGNSNTNVVCEGYAKAFQYLCDLSVFTNSATQSYIVDGDMNDESHMWNVVTLTGANGTANYMVDVTNTDGNGAGDRTGVFLKGAQSGSIASGYTFKYYTGQSLTYVYDEDQKDLYGAGGASILNVSLTDYVPPAPTPENPSTPGTDPEKPGTDQEKPGTNPSQPGTNPSQPGTDPEKPTPGDNDTKVPETLSTLNAAKVTLTYGYAASSAPTLRVTASNHNSQPRYQWYCNNSPVSGATSSSYKVPAALHSGTYSYYCKVTWPGTQAVPGETKTSSATQVVVQKRPLTIVPTEGLGKYTTEVDPQLTFTLGNTSLVAGDKLTGALSRKPGEASGTYAITLGTLGHRDYALTLVGNPTFEIRSPWVKQGGVWKCTQTGGGYATGWVQEGPTWYYCNKQGTMQTGWLQKGGVWYYLNPSGAMVTGWKSVNGTWYYFNGSGAMQTGWLNAGGAWYYLSPSGAMQTGWLKLGTTWYYFTGSGAMTTGWRSVGGVWYYFSESGAMTTGWQQIGGSWYYLNSSGAMLTGWQYISSAWYYFYGSGAMAANTSIGGYRLTASGAMV